MFNVAYLLLSKCYGTKGIRACISLDILEQGHCEIDQEINFLSRFLAWAVTSQSLRGGLACLGLLLPQWYVHPKDRDVP